MKKFHKGRFKSIIKNLKALKVGLFLPLKTVFQESINFGFGSQFLVRFVQIMENKHKISMLDIFLLIIFDLCLVIANKSAIIIFLSDGSGSKNFDPGRVR